MSTRILVALSIAFGISIAIIGLLAPSAAGTVATIGALVLGGLWVLRAIFIKRT